VPAAYVVLLLANVVYATSYAVTRLTLDDVPPAMLAFTRLAIGALILIPLSRALHGRRALTWRDRRTIFWMGAIGFAAAAGLSHWGIALSTASHAALLITAEPVSLVLLSPMLLGERLTPRERWGALLTLAGALLVVLNAAPERPASFLSYWRGDALLVLSGVAYAAYTLLGRGILMRHPALPVTAWSILWGAVAMAPLAGVEWAAGHRPRVTPAAVTGALYLAVVITALGYWAWNYALERVEASRAAIFLNVQPLLGALLGIWWLGEPLTPFVVAGGALILAGLHVAAKGGRIG
jgi:drug/metabolite transporter (DMT)-like permease